MGCAASSVDEAAQCMRISNMVSGQTMALVLSQGDKDLEGEDLKEAVARVISVHIDRLALFSTDGSMMECGTSAPCELLK